MPRRASSTPSVQDQISDPEQIADVLKRVEEEIAAQRSDLLDTLKLKEAELTAEQRRMANIVDYIGKGRGSQALAKALVESERQVDALSADSLKPPGADHTPVRHARS